MPSRCTGSLHDPDKKSLKPHANLSGQHICVFFSRFVRSAKKYKYCDNF